MYTGLFTCASGPCYTIAVTSETKELLMSGSVVYFLFDLGQVR